MANKIKKIKIVIGVPCQGTVSMKTAFSLVNAIKTLGVDNELLMFANCDIIGGRMWLVHEAIKRNATHLLFVDHDMFFPCSSTRDNPIRQLLDHRKDIVGASYNFRRLPLQPVESPLENEDKTGLFKCNAIGTGFMLINLEVFDKIPEPWFQFGRGSDGQLVYGEDAFFCQQAIKAGYDIWCDPLVNVKHVGEYLY